MNTPPDWLRRVGPSIDGVLPDWFAEFRPPPSPRRSSAVLILMAQHSGNGSEAGSGASPDLVTDLGTGEGVDVVLTERSHHLRSHAAQVSFPGGHIDSTDAGPVEAALREANEEVGLLSHTVDIVDELPALYMRPRENAVTPVIGWWREPHPIGVVDHGEVAQVARVPVSLLVDPANRFTVTGPRGYRGPGFLAGDMFVWGFTAKLLDAIFALGGIAKPWDSSIVQPLPEVQIGMYRSGRA